MQVQFEDHPTDPDKVILRKPKHPVMWFGLTPDESRAIAREFPNVLDAIYIAEDKLREKNARI
jgi:hypothetical protein